MPVAVNQLPPPPVDGGGWRGRLARLLWPSRCVVCREAGVPGLDLCSRCDAGLPRLRSACVRCALPLPMPGVCGACRRKPSPLGEVHAACLYAAPVDRLLPRFKFHGDLASGRVLSQLMIDAFRALPPPDALVPVPLHGGRLRARGYDQALELGRPLATALRIPLRSRVLFRVRATAPQSRQDAITRRRNVRRAFAVRSGASVPAHAVLVDDVMTTGATLHAAADALLRAGAVRVDAWVCARVP